MSGDDKWTTTAASAQWAAVKIATRQRSGDVRATQSPRGPNLKLDVDADLDGVSGGLLRERERDARDGAADEGVGAEVVGEILDLKRQPWIKGVFETSASGRAVLLVWPTEPAAAKPRPAALAELVVWP